MFKTIIIANLYGKTQILNMLESCQFKDFNTKFPFFNSWRQTASGNNKQEVRGPFAHLGIWNLAPRYSGTLIIGEGKKLPHDNKWV